MSDQETTSEQRARAIVEQQIASQDAATRSSLNQARQRALSELDKGWRWPVVLPLAGASAAAVLVAVLVLGREAQGPQPINESADDFELLLAEDSLEMLEELEFFEVLDGLSEVDDSVG